MNINIDELFKIIGIKPKNKKIYIEALTHKTFSNENKNFPSYEKLEFLGDSILQMKISYFIYKEFISSSEGEMSLLRSNYVQAKNLSKVIKQNKINELLICSNNKNNDLKENEKICSDIFESLLSAIYIDLGDEELNKFLHKFLFNDIITNSHLEQGLKDPKTQLQELLQPIHKKPVFYQTTKHYEKDFWKSVVISGEQKFGIGIGTTKKDAEINAAKDALSKLQK